MITVNITGVGKEGGYEAREETREGYLEKYKAEAVGVRDEEGYAKRAWKDVGVLEKVIWKMKNRKTIPIL